MVRPYAPTMLQSLTTAHRQNTKAVIVMQLAIVLAFAPIFASFFHHLTIPVPDSSSPLAAGEAVPFCCLFKVTLL